MHMLSERCDEHERRDTPITAEPAVVALTHEIDHQMVGDGTDYALAEVNPREAFHIETHTF